MKSFLKSCLIICFILNSINFFAQNETIKVPEPTKDTLYKIVDNPAHFPGGNTAWNKYFIRSFNVEVDSAQTGSTLTASFIVHKDGRLSDIIIQNQKAGRKEVEAAYVKLLREGPNWIAARKNGRNVTTRISWSITICLTEE